jgi:hypothetical protein
MSEQRLFDLVARLSARNVPFVIIGGHAVNYHGYLRATEDLDFVFRRSAASEEALLQTLEEFGAFWIGDEIDPQTGLEITHPVTLDFVRNHRLLMLGTVVGYVDIFDFLPGIPDGSLEEFFQAAEYSLGRPFASLDWLKRLKRAADRPQDRIDLERLP